MFMSTKLRLVSIRTTTIVVLVIFSLSWEGRSARTVKNEGVMDVLREMRSLGEEDKKLFKARELKGLFETRLPRGMVPPSGPSQCHNKLRPDRQNGVLSTNDYYVSCP